MSVKRYQPVAQCVEPSYQAQMIEPKVMEFSEGEYVRWEDYDATCETLAHTETERDASDAAVERLKAEVERLTERNKFLEQIDSYLQGANEHAYEKRCDELEAEVERLRKAGDAMAKAIKWLPQSISDHHLDAWNAAKEGKQS